MADDMNKAENVTLGSLLKRTEQLKQQNAELEKQIKSAEELGESTSDLLEAQKKLTAEIEETNDQLKDTETTQDSILENLKNQEKEISSLTGLQKQFVGLERQRLIMQTDLVNVSTKNIEIFDQIAKTVSDLSGVSAEDIVQREILNAQLEKQLESVNATSDAEKSIVSNLQLQAVKANQLASLTKKQQEFLETQIGHYDKIKDVINEVLQVTRLLTSTPGGLFGGALIGAGFLADKVGEVNKELGTTIGNTNALGTAALNIIGFEKATEVTRGLTQQLGSAEKATFGLKMDANLLATNLGLSGDETATLVNQFGQLSGQTTEASLNMIKSAQATAQMAGVIPNDVMKDLASNTEHVALFAKGTGENMAQAAIQARQLGLSLQTTSKVSEKLLDFESSIQAELEASAMLGRDINFQKARELAYSGDQVGATKEIINQLGTIDDFNQMDFYQKKKIAEATGLTVDEMQKMIANQQNLNTFSGKMENTFSKVSEWSNYIGNEWGGGILKGIGGAVMAASTFGKNVSDIGDRTKDATGLLGKMKALLGFGPKGVPTTIAPPISSTTTAPSGGTPPGGGSPADQAGKLGKMNPTAIIAGAAAMVIAAAAVFVFAKAVQEFMSVSWESVGMAVVSMLALVGAVALLGAIMSSGVGAVAILAGAAAMLVVAGAMWVLGDAMQSMGTGLKMQSDALTNILPTLTSVGTVLAGMMTYSDGIETLAGALGSLATSLALIGTFGALALPVLQALSATGQFGATLGGGEGGGGDKTSFSDVVAAIDNLKTELMGKQLVVELDGKKIYENVAFQNRTTNVTIRR